MSIKISIIEDHEIYRKALANLLVERDEIEIGVLAGNGKDFLDQQVGKSLPDVILLDFEMPVMDGPASAAAIRSQYGNRIKILALSIHKEPRLVDEMLEAGANGFISKEASAEELFMGIRSVLEFDYYISPSISSQIFTRKDGTLSVMEKDPITPKEREVLELICQQKTNKEIAEALNVSDTSAHTYRNRLLAKTRMKNTAGLVVFAIQEGIFRVS